MRLGPDLSYDPPPPGEGRRDERFVQLLTAEQSRLRLYLMMLVGDANEVDNILQETNLVLWRKSDEFQFGRSFTAWSKRIAYWQVKAFFRDRGRDKHVFGNELIDQLTELDCSEELDQERRVALRQCLRELGESARALLAQRYDAGVPINVIASQQGKTPESVRSALLRLRRSLQQRIENRLAANNHGPTRPRRGATIEQEP